MIGSATKLGFWVLVALGILWWLFPDGALLWMILGGATIKIWFWIVVIVGVIHFVRDVWREE